MSQDDVDREVDRVLERVALMVESNPESKWEAQLQRIVPEHLRRDLYVVSGIEILCGGDAVAVDERGNRVPQPPSEKKFPYERRTEIDKKDA